MTTAIHHDLISISETSSNGGSSSECEKATKEVHIDPKRYKTKLCRNFLKDGACPYETRCMFAHGPHELRTPDENTRDGLVTESAIKRHQQQLMYMARNAAASTTTSTPASEEEAATEAPAPCTCPDCVPQASPAMYTHDPYGTSAYSYGPYTTPYSRFPAGYCDCPECNAAFMMPPPYAAAPPPPAYFPAPVDFDVYAP